MTDSGTNLELPINKQLFVVIAMMRSGSNLLQQKLNAISGVMCHGEIFNSTQSGLNPQFEKNKPLVSKLKAIDRQARPFEYLNKLVEVSNAEHVGFRLFEGHHNDIITDLARDARIFKIILVRNFLESYVSLEIACQTDQWVVNHPNTRKKWKPVEINFNALKTYALRQSLFYQKIINQCVLHGQEYLVLDYSAINEESTEEKLLAHFGNDRQIDRSRVSAQRQNPESLAEKIANYSDLIQKLKDQRLDCWLCEDPV